MNKTLGIVIAAVLIVGGLWYWKGKKSDVVMDKPPIVTDVAEQGSKENVPIAITKTFTVIGKQFSFSPAEIKVKKGDTVRIVFQNVEGTHDWVIDEFNVRTSKIQGGQSETIEFVADKIGSFEYYCSVGQHRQMGMKGTLIVD